MYGAIEKGKEQAGPRSLPLYIYLFLQMLRRCSALLFFSPKLIFCSYKGNDEKFMPLHFAGLFYY
jgi:hypothetical protein